MTRTSRLMAAATLALSGGTALALPINVVNYSFEDNVLADGQSWSTINQTIGWNRVDDPSRNWGTGIYNPFNREPSYVFPGSNDNPAGGELEFADNPPGPGVPDGRNIAYVFQNNCAMWQQTSAALTLNLTYTLTAALGDRPDDANSDTPIQILAGADLSTATLLAEFVVGGVTIPNNTFQDYSVSFGPSSPNYASLVAAHAGEPLIIAFRANSATLGETDIDNVRFSDSAIAGPATWNVNSGGDWNVSGNWSGNQVPTGAGAEAHFGSITTSARTVYSDLAVTLGWLDFNSANTYVLAGSANLTIDVTSGAGSVTVAQGSHKISLPLTFAADTAVSVASGASLTVTDLTTIKAGKTVTKSGNLVIQAPLTLEAGASLVLASGPTSAFGAPSLATGAKIDVKTNSMTVDYRGQASPAATIKAQLASGYASGAWNGQGINTSSAVANQTALGWKDDAATQSILVKYTYYGDANLDGQVDISDLGALATAWQTSAVWSQGDFDYSGFVDISDLGKLATNWQLGVGNPLGPSFDEALASVGLAGVSVPEPAMLGLAGLAASMLCSRKRR